MRKIPIPKAKINPVYDSWNKVKKNLTQNTNVPYIKEGRIFWCSVGQNIGTEIYGKGKGYARPVLVYKKLSRLNFIAIPLSTKVRHDNTWYIPFNFAGIDQAAVISQIRVMDVARLLRYVGELPQNDFDKIKAGFKKLYF